MLLVTNINYFLLTHLVWFDFCLD